MTPIKNIFMCLVHENQDCIIDLIRNLNYLDPKSTILLYNGGTNKDLFEYFPFERYNVIIHPNPKPLKWGWLHDFAIDCMEYAIEKIPFDTITVVDSDQLAVGKNYTDFISKTIRENPQLGMLGQISNRILPDTKIDPAITAYQEQALWQPFLEQLPNGKEAFLHWTFWPSTTFTKQATVDLVKLFRTNKQLQDILKVTKIWASEEIFFPTLIIALGYTIVENPCSFDFVKYKKNYLDTDIEDAVKSENNFWIHPIERKINNSNRISIRNHFNNYTDSKIKNKYGHFEQLITEIVAKTNSIEGWLQPEETELLASLSYKKASKKKNPLFVELGSYCGKSTAVMALATKETNSKTKIIAIDDFSGKLGAEDIQIEYYPSSLQKFNKTIESLSITNNVTIIKETPHKLDFNQVIDILLIDGLHDYASIARDFYAYEKNVASDGYLLFHDYCSHFPGVLAFVDELLTNGSYRIIEKRGSLIALKRLTNKKKQVKKIDMVNKPELFEKKLPLVSCIMPTYNRPEFISHAITQFLQQDYDNKELIIIDDSTVSIEELIPDTDLIHYSYYTIKLDLGTKRNLACKKANGEIIIHLDDDDFYAPDWIQKQVSFLIANDLEITGLSNPVFYDKNLLNMWQYEYPKNSKSWVYGATLCYTKQLWTYNNFSNSNCGEDNTFVWNNNVKKILPHNNCNSYIGQIHQKNTSPKETKDKRWTKLEQEQSKTILKYHHLIQDEILEFMM